MHRKILAICAALVAFAIVPAMASASPHLTKGATAASVGETITVVNRGTIVFTSNLGSVTCSDSKLHGTVVTNSGKLIEGTISSASFNGDTTGTGVTDPCTSWTGDVTVTPENLHWCIKSSVLGAFSLRGGACTAAEKNLAFALHFSFGACKFERSGGVNGTYTSDLPPAFEELTLPLTGEPEFKLVSGGFGCPSSGKLHAAYTLAGYRIT